MNMSTLMGAVATSTQLTSPTYPPLYAHSPWLQWAMGALVGVGLLVVLVLAVWLCRILAAEIVQCLLRTFGMEGEEERVEVANAPVCVCSIDSVPLLHIRNRATKLCVVCELALLSKFLHDSERNLANTRAKLAEILAQAHTHHEQ